MLLNLPNALKDRWIGGRFRWFAGLLRNDFLGRYRLLATLFSSTLAVLALATGALAEIGLLTVPLALAECDEEPFT